MKHSVKPLLLCALFGLSAPLFAQTQPAPIAGPVVPLPAPAVNQPAPASPTATGPDSTDEVTKTPQGNIKFKVVAPPNLFAPVKATRPLKIGVYFRTETNKDALSLVAVSKRLEGAEVTPMLPEAFATTDLSKFDMVIFPGGTGGGQAKSIGDKGLQNVRDFVKNGGSYMGICAGAYLATSCYPWSLGLYNAKTRQPWARGNGAVSVQLTDEGKALFGNVDAPFPVFYNGGPMIEMDEKASPELDHYKVLAYFRDEVAPKPAQVGQMVNAPAIVTATYGKGKVLTISPHFEVTKNMENFLPHAIEWLGEKPTP